MEKEQIPARTPDIGRRAAPGNRAETHPADLRSILALQRSAGNRAVGSLLAYAPRARVVGRATQLDLPVQREPEEPETEEPETRPILWPEDTEAERNEPCFNGEDQGKISIGFAWADSAAADLTAMPPNLPVAVSTLEAADQSWAATRGTNPGKAQLDGARSTIGRELTRVGTRVEPVGAQLDLAQNAALDASAEASAASTMMTTPKPPEDPEEAQEEPEPCFQEGEQAVIAEAVNLADAAAAELGKRPPNYRRALASLRSAAAKLDGVGGMEPGGPRLAAAAARGGRRGRGRCERAERERRCAWGRGAGQARPLRRRRKRGAPARRLNMSAAWDRSSASSPPGSAGTDGCAKSAAERRPNASGPTQRGWFVVAC